jgi:hypothetical protein
MRNSSITAILLAFSLIFASAQEPDTPHPAAPPQPPQPAPHQIEKEM